MDAETMEYIDKKMGEYNMGTGVGFEDTGVLSLLGGNGGGGILNNNRVTDVIGAAGVANGTATNANILANRDIEGLGIDRISDQNEETRRNLGEARVMDNITGGHNRICERLNDNEVRVTGDIVASEFRGIARDNATNARIEANNAASIQRDHQAALDAKDCCCKLEAEMKAIETRGVRDQLMASQALVVANTAACNQARLEALIEARCGGHHGG